MMQMRPAAMSDAEALFGWRNDDLTRRMFKTSDAVKWDDHVAWLGRRLARTEPRIFIADKDGYPVGTIRIDDDNSLSYTVGAEWRNRGYAIAMLQWVFENFGPCIAEIKPENLWSIRAASKTGHVVKMLAMEGA